MKNPSNDPSERFSHETAPRIIISQGILAFLTVIIQSATYFGFNLP
ncbi:MAG: hypothetical protein ABIP06_13785 [Pyrinomonadaceae bacterium]